MKQALQNRKKKGVVVEELPVPSVSPGTILVRNRYSLISPGTERSTLQWSSGNLVSLVHSRPDLTKKVINYAKKSGVRKTLDLVKNRLSEPIALGYSSAGVVAKCGDGIDGFKLEDRVACAGQGYASHAQFVVVPKNLAVPIPGNVSDEDASFVAVGAVALQSVRQATPQLGERVAVIGLGIVGQLVLQLLKANGCTAYGIDLSKERQELAKKCGADWVGGSEEAAQMQQAGGGSFFFDHVIVAAHSSSPAPLNLATDLLRPRGSLIVVGAVPLELDREKFYAKDLQLKVSVSYGPGRYDTSYEEKGIDYPAQFVRWTEKRNMEAFLALVENKSLNLEPLRSKVFPVEKAAEAYDLLNQGQSTVLGILLDHGTDSSSDAEQKHELQLSPERKEGSKGIAILGASKHLTSTLLPALKLEEPFHISQVVSRRPHLAKNLAEELGAPLVGSNYTSAIQSKESGVVLISSRHNEHAALVLKAIAEQKDIFVEKPLCIRPDELKEISRVYRQSGQQSRLHVGFNRRFSALTSQMKAQLESRDSPVVLEYRVCGGPLPKEHWLNDASVGGGRLVGEACHFVDLICYLVGKKAVEVFASDVRSTRDEQLSDGFTISIRFVDGSLGILNYLCVGSQVQEKERIECHWAGSSLLNQDFSSLELMGKKKKKLYRGVQDKGFAVQWKKFLESVLNREAPPAIPFSEIEQTTLICFEALKSMVTRASVRLGDVE